MFNTYIIMAKLTVVCSKWLFDWCSVQKFDYNFVV